MSALSRRSFGAASLGAVAAGVIATTKPESAAAAPAPASTPEASASLKEPVVAHLEDLRSGRVVLYTGDRRVDVVDHALAQQLAKHAERRSV